MGAAPILYPLEGVHPFGYTLFDLVYAIGAAGVATSVRAAGVTSITRNGAGDYTLVLDAKYVDVYNVDINIDGTYTRTDGVKTWLSAIGTDATTGYTTIRFFVYPDNGASTTKTEILSGNNVRLNFGAKMIATPAG